MQAIAAFPAHRIARVRVYVVAIGAVIVLSVALLYLAGHDVGQHERRLAQRHLQGRRG